MKTDETKQQTEFSEDQQPTRRRGRARRVTKGEVQAAWDKLRDAAEAGDVQACGWLIYLTEGVSSLYSHKDAGTINPRGVGSGWSGDQNDPKGKILEAIRENDPQSKQLPENQ